MRRPSVERDVVLIECPAWRGFHRATAEPVRPGDTRRRRRRCSRSRRPAGAIPRRSAEHRSDPPQQLDQTAASCAVEAAGRSDLDLVAAPEAGNPGCRGIGRIRPRAQKSRSPHSAQYDCVNPSRGASDRSRLPSRFCGPWQLTQRSFRIGWTTSTKENGRPPCGPASMVEAGRWKANAR